MSYALYEGNVRVLKQSTKTLTSFRLGYDLACSNGIYAEWSRCSV